MAIYGEQISSGGIVESVCRQEDSGIDPEDDSERILKKKT